MTIIKDRDDRQIECDSCSNSTEVYDERDFGAMIADAKRNGWRIEASSDGYSHTCPDCVGGSRLDRQRALFGR